MTVTHHYADLSQVQMHYVTAGSGEPLVLLHGYPQTWLCWERVIPLLTDRYQIIAPDLRGLGDTSRPAEGYDKKTVAADVWELVHDVLGHDTFDLAGHDWGGVVAYRLAADHRDAVTNLAIVDVAIPGDGAPNIGAGGKRWHHGFLQTLDLPEALVADREHLYLGWFWKNYGHQPDAISADHIAEYLRCYTSPGATRAGFAYYRTVGIDAADNASEPQLEMPVLAVAGGTSWGRGAECGESCRRVAKDVTELILTPCGHWVPDEQPEQLADAFRDFFRERP
jgi:pimeloyl-ACP methyl ester carboxylesterase